MSSILGHRKGSCIWWNMMTRLVADKTMTSQLKPSGQVTYHEYFFEASSISHIILLFNDFSTYSTIKYPATGTLHASVQPLNLSSFCLLVSLVSNDSKLMLLFLELFVQLPSILLRLERNTNSAAGCIVRFCNLEAPVLKNAVARPLFCGTPVVIHLQRCMVQAFTITFGYHNLRICWILLLMRIAWANQVTTRKITHFQCMIQKREPL